jgi:hypothetical protein
VGRITDGDTIARDTTIPTGVLCRSAAAPYVPASAPEWVP